MERNKQIILVLLLGLVCLNLHSQESNKNILHIKKVFSEINSNKNLTKIEMAGEDFLAETPDGGALLTGYFDHTSLLKITFWIGLSFGTQQIDYYFSHDSLLFAFVTERHFRIIRDSVDFEHKETVLEGRYYFVQDKLFERKVRGKGFWDKEQEKNLIPDSKSYFALLMEKKNAN